MYCVVESAGRAAIAEDMLEYVAQDAPGPTTKAVDGIDVGRAQAEDGTADDVELPKLEVDEVATDELLVIEEVKTPLVDVLVPEVAKDVRDAEPETTALAAEIAFRIVASTQEVFGVVYPVNEFAKT